MIKKSKHIVISLFLIIISVNLYCQNAELAVQTGHTADILLLTFSNNGSLLASADKANRIKLWYVPTGNEMATLSNRNRITTLSFSPDDKYVVFGDEFGKIVFWDIINSNEKQHLSFNNRINAIHFSTDRNILFVAADKLYRVNLSNNSSNVILNDEIINITFNNKSNRYYLLNKHFEIKVIDNSGKLLSTIEHVVNRNKIRNKTKEKAIYKSHHKLIYYYNFLGYSDGFEKAIFTKYYSKLLFYNVKSGKNTLEINSDYDQSFNSAISSKSYGYLFAANGDGKIYVINSDKGNIIKKLKGHYSDVNCLAINNDETHFASGSSDRSIIIWDTEKLTQVVRLYSRSYPIKCMDIDNSGNSLAFGDEYGYLKTVVMNSNDLSLRSIKKHVYAVSGLEFLNKSDKIVSCGKDNKIVISDRYSLLPIKSATYHPSLNLKYLAMKFFRIFNIHFEPYIFPNSMDLCADEKYIIVDGQKGNDMNTGQLAMGYQKATRIFNTNSLNRKRKFASKQYSRICQKTVYKVDTTYLKGEIISDPFRTDIETSFPQKILIWDEKKGTQRKAIGTKIKHFQGEVTQGGLIAPRKTVLSNMKFINGDTIAYIYDSKRAFYNVDSVFVLSDLVYFSRTDQQGSSKGLKDLRSTLVLYNLNTEKNIGLFIEHDRISDYTFNVDGSKLAFGAGKEIVLINLADYSRKRFKGHSDLITSISFSPDNKTLYSSSEDATIKIWDIEKGTLTATIVPYDKDEIIILTADNYYYAPKGALEGVGFKVRDQFFPPEQFDLKFNRPDIVLSRLGFVPREIIDINYNAYQKRLKKMGFTEAMLNTEFHLPEIYTMDKDLIPITTEVRNLKIKVIVKDNKYNLDRINVFINDVPIHGVSGINLRELNTDSTQMELDVILANGDNKVQLSVLNEKGVESLKETFQIELAAPDKSPDLYLVAIGISEYLDGRFNLDYAAKDAIDLTSLFKGNQKMFKKIHTQLLSDEQVTKDNLLQLKEFLEKAGRDDIVIVFIAGHGILDKNLDYYYATYDIDFNNPSIRGIAYETIENLLDGIKALKKILFMDTCHSGELDKDEIEVVNATKLEEGEIKFRSSGVGVRYKQGIGIRSTNELMRELFIDLRRGTGSSVISSAGGAEFAMESGEWSNGLFTYCILNGIKTGKADMNKDKEILLSELQEYVRENVKELSGGMQVPTSRTENISLDFRIW